MTAENDELSPEFPRMQARGTDDGRGPLVIAAGLGAALLAGFAWAAVAMLTQREIGFAAWGVGIVVGFAMSRMTARRSRTLGFTAAGLAAVGLLVGRVVIFAGSAGQVAREIEADTTVLGGLVSWQMYDARELDPPTLQALDAVSASGDTVPDALWAAMQAQGTAKLAAMTAAEKHEIAMTVAKTLIQNMGIVAGVRGQLSLFDVLWLLLAVATAYGFMVPEKAKATAAVEAAGPTPSKPTNEEKPQS